MPAKLLNESDKITLQHYKILGMSWAGWVFDFYDLILFTFLLIPISKEYGFSNLQMSYILGSSLSHRCRGRDLRHPIRQVRTKSSASMDHIDL
jgi:hypothetical protein